MVSLLVFRNRPASTTPKSPQIAVRSERAVRAPLGVRSVATEYTVFRIATPGSVDLQTTRRYAKIMEPTRIEDVATLDTWLQAHA